MTADQMREGLSLLSEAEKLRRQLDKFILLKRDSNASGETIQVGDPVLYREREYHRLNVPIPEDARRLVFNLWRREVARQYNAKVRQLNQLGVSHSFSLEPSHDQ